MKTNLELLELHMAVARKAIAHQEQLALRLEAENQPDLAERARELLEKMTADIEHLRDLQRNALHEPRRPPASSRVAPRRRTGRG